MNKILIIDDDRELCALIKRSVQAENIEADFCNTGKEGLQKLREQEYQLVVKAIWHWAAWGKKPFCVSSLTVRTLPPSTSALTATKPETTLAAAL